MATRKVFIQRDKLNDALLSAHGFLILTVGSFEWLLQEVIIFLTLKKNFDITQKSHLVLADHVQSLTFDGKIKLVKKFELLSEDTSTQLNVIRERRNIFVHGIFMDTDQGLFIQIKNGKKNEQFTLNNIEEFRTYIELAGGTLITELEKSGFRVGDPLS